MLKIWKYLLYSIVFVSYSYSDILTWGGYSKLDISKEKVDAIIKTYVDTTYPDKVKEYSSSLVQTKKQKLASVSDVSFVYEGLMWQDTLKNSTLYLNQLEAKIYCKNLKLAKRKDWRLPTYKELLKLVDYSNFNPAAIKKIKFIKPSTYWSDTQKVFKKQTKLKSYWFVDFTSGKSDFGNEMEKRYVRCVRELSSKKDNY